MPNRTGEKWVWQSIHRTFFSKDVAKQRRLMAMILRQLHRMSQEDFRRRCSQLYTTDSVEGPEAVAWGLQMMAAIQPPGPDRMELLRQMDHCKNDAAVMRRIRNGWKLFGVEDPWWVVHDQPVPTLARYHSEPSLCVQKGRV